MSRLIHIPSSFRRRNSKSDCQGWYMCKGLCPENLMKKTTVIIRSLQHKAFPEVFACIQEGKEIPKQSQLRKLSPYPNDAGCFKVSGRLSQADLESDKGHPLIILHQRRNDPANTTLPPANPASGAPFHKRCSGVSMSLGHWRKAVHQCHHSQLHDLL